MSKSPPANESRHPKHWADRDGEVIDFSKKVNFSDSDPEDRPTGLIEVSETTRQLLTQKCIRRMPNKERLARRSHYPLPKVAATRAPQLDSFMRLEVSPAVKSGDRELAKLQTLLLDALAPLTSILEGDARGETLDQEEVVSATRVAIELLGNAVAHITHTRRTKVTSD